MIEFTKMHGLGNDYLLVDAMKGDTPDEGKLPAIAKAMSDRHFGIGADGIILVEPSRAADFKMRVFNSDGSEAEMCGNGIRCVAKFAYDHGLVRKEEIAAETGAGILTLKVFTNSFQRVDRVRVNLGRPRLTRGEIPMTGAPDEQVINAPVEVLDLSLIHI